MINWCSPVSGLELAQGSSAIEYPYRQQRRPIPQQSLKADSEPCHGTAPPRLARPIRPGCRKSLGYLLPSTACTHCRSAAYLEVNPHVSSLIEQHLLGISREQTGVGCFWGMLDELAIAVRHQHDPAYVVWMPSIRTVRSPELVAQSGIGHGARAVAGCVA